MVAVVSPKFHVYEVIVAPFDGTDAAASTVVRAPSTVGLGDAVKVAVGKVDDTPTTVTADVVVSVAPELSVTVSATLYVPAVAKRCVVVATADGPNPDPSPKFQLYVAIVRPAGAVDEVALNWTVVVVVGAVGEKTKLALGAPAVAAVTVTVFDVVPVAPPLSVTVSVTL